MKDMFDVSVAHWALRNIDVYIVYFMSIHVLDIKYLMWTSHHFNQVHNDSWGMDIVAKD